MDRRPRADPRGEVLHPDLLGEEDLHHAPVPRRAFRQARQDGDGGLLAGGLHLYQSYFHLVLGSLDDREGDGDPDALRHNRAGGLCRYLFDIRRIEGGGADGVVQVVFLVGGGLVTTYIALDLLGEGDGVYQGMVNLYGEASDKFHLILDKSHPGYKDLPGISVILGGLWVANLYYWGCNQYIIQRAWAAKSVREAQNGMLFAGFIKLFIPLLVVIPGIAAFALDAPLGKSDEAYPWLLGNLLPVGVKGVAFAALTAAIVSSLASMMNSISTIFTMDIYRSYFRKEAGQKELVHTGRWASFGSLLVAVLIAPMLSGLDQAFQYIQEFTGFVSPGALSIFLAGFFYKRATANGALVAALGSFVFSFGMKFLFPGLPWMDRMGLVFLMCCALIVLLGKKGQPANAYTRHDPALFHTGRMFNVMSVVILAILIGFYYFWW